MDMFASRIGEFAALGTAFCWTITALSFESAGKRVGSLSVNLIRLWIAALFLAAYSFITRGRLLPLDAGPDAWLWLTLSGLVGFVLGDLLLFRAFILIGARISMLVFSSAPPMTALIGMIVLGERLSLMQWCGMMITVAGIVLVVTKRPQAEESTVLDAAGGAGPVPFAEAAPGNRAAVARRSAPSAGRRMLAGVLLALGGAFGQAFGLVLSRLGVGDYDPFAATQIRGFAGIAGFSLIFFVLRRWPNVWDALRNGQAMRRITTGAFFGPFLGVSLSLLAVQYTTTGVASTIIALVPVLIIGPSVFLLRERVTLREGAGAALAVTGVAVLFLLG